MGLKNTALFSISWHQNFQIYFIHVSVLAFPILFCSCLNTKENFPPVLVLKLGLMKIHNFSWALCFCKKKQGRCTTLLPWCAIFCSCISSKSVCINSGVCVLAEDQQVECDAAGTQHCLQLQLSLLARSVVTPSTAGIDCCRLRASCYLHTNTDF